MGTRGGAHWRKRRSFAYIRQIHGSGKQGQSSFNRVTGLLFLTDHPHEHLTVSGALVLKARRLAPDHPWADFTLAMLGVFQACDHLSVKLVVAQDRVRRFGADRPVTHRQF